MSHCHARSLRLSALAGLALLTSALPLAACGDEAAAPDTTDTTDTADTTDTTDSVAPDTTPDTVDTSDTLADADTSGPVFTLHVHRPDGITAGLTVNLTGDTVAPTAALSRTDDFGAVFEIPLTATATTLTYQIAGPLVGALEPADPVTVTLTSGTEAWHFAGSPTPLFAAPPAIPAADELVVFYLRKDAAYDGWGLHLWQDVAQETAWTAARIKDGVDPELGAYWRIPLKADAKTVGIIVHRGDEKDPGPDMTVELATTGN
ncbi:MAG: hypothetical protein JNJ59_10290, partial [Deltaproteobacteria bacterium]|nr:hypothetical protein [Deltaproteobacteria bacterium]